MLSPEQYNELVKAHDQRILDAVDGGGIHSCGDFGQLVDPYLSIDTLKCLDIGQSYLLDIAKWYPILCERRIPMLRIDATPDAIRSGELIRRFPTGVTFRARLEDPTEACDLIEIYRKTTTN